LSKIGAARLATVELPAAAWLSPTELASVLAWRGR
jgi:hypothetical protein